jgi:hypothetical protein
MVKFHCLVRDPFHQGMARPHFKNGSTASNMDRSWQYVDKQSRKADKVRSYSLGFGRGDIRTLHLKLV